MNIAEKQVFWEDNFPKFGIRLSKQLSYLDTKIMIGNNPTKMKMSFKINALPSGTKYNYLFATGASSWFTCELFEQTHTPTFNIGNTTGIKAQYDKAALFNTILDVEIDSGNGIFIINGDWSAEQEYTGEIKKDSTLTIGCAVNRNVQEGQSTMASLQNNRLDMTLYRLQIFESGEKALDLFPYNQNGIPCFKDRISGMAIQSFGPDQFEFDRSEVNK